MPIIGTLHEYVLTKKYSLDRLHWNGLQKFAEFGPIVTEELVPGLPIVWLFDPEDIKTMYACEGRYPSRRSHLALQKYRLDRPHIYNNGGLLPTNGPEWARLRQAAQKPLTPNVLATYIPQIDQAAQDFVEMLIEKGPDIGDVLEELKKYFLEVTALVTLDTRIGAITGHLHQNSVPKKLMQAAFQTNAHVLKTDNGLRLWRYYETKDFVAIRKSQEYIEKVALEHVNKKIASNSKTTTTLLDHYLTQPDLDMKDVVTLVADFILAGIDTSSYTMAFLLYEISRNPLVLARLHGQVEHINGSLNNEAMKQFRYGKWILKEALRLHPVSVGVGRVVAQDGIYSGHKVPQGTMMVTQNQVSCRLDHYCPYKPLEFVPERWSKKSDVGQKIHPYLSLPFGFGPRMCIGRRLAELGIQMLLMKLAINFKMEWIGGENVDCKSLLINQPDSPISLRLTPR